MNQQQQGGEILHQRQSRRQSNELELITLLVQLDIRNMTTVEYNWIINTANDILSICMILAIRNRMTAEQLQEHHHELITMLVTRESEE